VICLGKIEDVIKKGSDHRAWTLQENGYGSVDVDTSQIIYRKHFTIGVL
jgi:hypothetical protein